MLDPQLLRDNPQYVAEQLKKRGFHFDVQAFVILEDQRKLLQVATQALQNDRNQRSKLIGQAKAHGEDITVMREEVNRLGEELQSKKTELDEVLKHLDALLFSLPNLPHPSVPEGRDEQDNQEVRRWGAIPTFDFAVKSHDELGEALAKMDFALAAKITGSRFVVMKAELASPVG